GVFAGRVQEPAELVQALAHAVDGLALVVVEAEREHATDVLKAAAARVELSGAPARVRLVAEVHPTLAQERRQRRPGHLPRDSDRVQQVLPAGDDQFVHVATFRLLSAATISAADVLPLRSDSSAARRMRANVFALPKMYSMVSCLTRFSSSRPDTMPSLGACARTRSHASSP